MRQVLLLTRLEKRLYRANYVPLWDYLMEHIRPAPETDMVRANLAANGVTVAGAARNKDESAVLEEERRRLLAELKQEEERLAQHEGEVRQLSHELSAGVSVLAKERAASGEAQSRSLIGDAMERVLEASVQVYEEYSRRLAQEAERLSYFVGQEDGMLLDAELVARSQLLAQAMASARADEKTARETMAEADRPSVAVEHLLYDMQRQHVAQFVATEELKQQGARHLGDARDKDLVEEAAELRAGLAVLKAEYDRLVQDKTSKLLLAQDLRDRSQEVAALQRELKSTQEHIEALLASGSQNRAALLQLKSELSTLVQEHVLSLEDAFAPLAERVRDSVKREYEQFERHSLSLLLRSTAAPQGPGLPTPLVRNLRIHSSSPQMEQAARALGFSGGPCMDQLLAHIFALALQARELPHTAMADWTTSLDREIRAAREHHDRAVATEIAPLLQRAQRASLQVEELKEAVHQAFLEWKTLPAQFCVPDEEQRERFMRRYNYLRVLAHDAAKRGK